MPAVVPESDNVTINIKDFVFAPKTITVKKGTTITWINLDQAKHTVSADNRAQFDSRDMPSGKQFSFTFASAGTFPYYCEYHGDKGGVDMAAVIVVQE
ncbi:MAG: cupredoxin domain-containing protein [Chloroflexi bacterium]|nr:cupredoxin domain-containing protein [Chloroflexota bacterium]